MQRVIDRLWQVILIAGVAAFVAASTFLHHWLLTNLPDWAVKLMGL